MVEVEYTGNLGNKLFQYCFGRIIATHLGYKLKVDPIPGFPHTAAVIDGQDYSAYPAQVLTEQGIGLAPVLSDKSKRKIVLRGYFERYEYYSRIKMRYAMTGW